jgi:hypothetical protein
MPETLTVLNPVGFPPPIAGKRLNQPLQSLDGKTICLVDGRFHDCVLPLLVQMQAWFERCMPGVRTEIVRWREPFSDDPEASRLIAERGDAAIMGVGI